MIFIKNTHIYFKLEVSYMFGNIKLQRNYKSWMAGLSMKNKISLFSSFNDVRIPRYTYCKSQNNYQQ